MNKTKIVFVIILAIVLSGCSNGDFSIISDYPPNPELTAYLPVNEYEYLGEGSYYHYYRNLSVEEEHDRILVSISGEVKDNSRSIEKNDYGFQIELWVDSEKMVQKYSGEMLNESEFNSLILLKNPIAEKAAWEFDAIDKSGQKHVVTGQIIEIDEESGTVVIEYTTEAGNYEKRTIEKNRGTTSFIKQVSYKDAITYTGYHSIPIESVATNGTDIEILYDTLETIEIDFDLYEMIEGFNVRWVNYIKNIDQSLLELIDLDSNAYSKVVAIKEESIPLNDYIGFKPYKLELREETTFVYVIEKFVVGGNRSHYNAICYEVIEKEEGLFISDFYQSSP